MLLVVAFAVCLSSAVNVVYDPVLDAWSTVEALPTSRHGLGSAVVDGTLYVIGGGTSAGLSASTIVEAYRDE